jgi:RNA polymerase sigma factor (sigma-70 family)
VDKSSSIDKGYFDALLDWLAPNDRQRAGKKYEEIRQSLIKLFVWRGCADAEDLADETIDRVAQRLPELGKGYERDPSLYFYGFARNILKEYQRRKDSPAASLPIDVEKPEIDVAQETYEDESGEHMQDCLDRCLQKLSTEQRELVMQYYESSKRAKIEARKQLATQLGLSPNHLRVRMYRIRYVLAKCVERCMTENSVKNETAFHLISKVERE